MLPQFDYVPAFSDLGQVTVSAVQLIGVSTKHGDGYTDRGRLYARIVSDPAGVAVNLYAGRQRQDGQLVASGAGAVGAYIDLAAAGASQISGTMLVQAWGGSQADFVLCPTFAVDTDVLINQAECSRLPAYDPTWGLSFVQADAARELLAGVLPSEVPHLFGNKGLAPQVPGQPASVVVGFPDLRRIANVDQLRIAQGQLCKARACEQAEHVPEWRELGEHARARFVGAMEMLKAANVEEVIAQTEESGATAFTWRRG